MDEQRIREIVREEVDLLRREIAESRMADELAKIEEEAISRHVQDVGRMAISKVFQAHASGHKIVREAIDEPVDLGDEALSRLLGESSLRLAPDLGDGAVSHDCQFVEGPSDAPRFDGKPKCQFSHERLCKFATAIVGASFCYLKRLLVISHSADSNKNGGAA